MDRTFDYVFIVAFLIGVALFGIFKGGKQKTVEDYSLGSKSVPWWAVCFSIVAAEISTLSFISIPGLAYLTNLNFLQVTFGYFIGRLIIANYFPPSYFSGELNTAYAYLEKRFGHKTSSFASIVFLFTRMVTDGVRLFIAAMASLASYICSLFSSTMVDLYNSFNKNRNKSSDLKVSRLFTAMWVILLIFASLFLMNLPQTVVELALSIASFTYGGLLGTFILGLFVKQAKQEDVLPLVFLS